MRRTFLVPLFIFSLTIPLLGACSGQADGAASAVQTYLDGLVNKDADQVINVSCLDWESAAQAEIDSFLTVDAVLEDVTCQESGSEGDTTLVACTGNIVFSYGDENQYLGLEGQTYLVVQEGGEWRMCGYK
ncbi:MAG: hypothetical protein JXB38_00100 [Anaerolineales bacterium]|nr:hypothetical protein [Anaerolineales bacterium]